MAGDGGGTSVRRVRDILEMLSFVAVIGGVLVGFSEHFAAKAESARATAEHVYDDLDTEYRGMLADRLRQPRLDRLVQLDSGLPADVTEAERAQLRTWFSLAIDLYERAYLGYHDEERVALVSAATRAQWGGWEASIDKDLRNPEFVETWRAIGGGFDRRFQDYIKARLAR